MMAVESAEVSAMAPLAALVVRLENRLMMALASGAPVRTMRVRLQSIRNITHRAPITMSRFWV
jgi:hypothetical protein